MTTANPKARPETRTQAPFDPLKVRADFPILSTTAHGKPLVYLDNGATTQKPRQVIDAERRYYETQNANIHRGVYHLSQLATELYEDARRKVQRFINAAEAPEVLFTRGTTEGINLVAASWGRTNLTDGDEIIISALEHHSNIVPWQLVSLQTGAVLRVIPVAENGELRMDEYAKLLSPRTKMVAVTHLSNSLGTINDAKWITQMAHAVGARVLIDGAQWVAHYPTDVRDIGCDFYVFSGHKLFGPTGIGVLYGKRQVLDAMPPYQGGGDMIENVTFERTTFAKLPNKFEAGTPNIAGAVGLGAAIDYVQALGFSYVDHEHDLLDYATAQLNQVPGLHILGTSKHKGTVLSFVFDDMSALDVGTKLDAEGIAIRTGHHCCQPLMDRMKVSGTARASLAMYNTRDDVDALVRVLKRIREDARPAAGTPAKAPATSIEWPVNSSPSPEAAADELAEDFAMLEDHNAKSEYVLDLGAKLPHAFDLLKQITTRIPGCMSQVYLVARRSPTDAGRMEFIADADAEIVRGLIAILEKIYSGQPPQAVLKFDIEGFFRRIGLDQFITTQRRNGLAGMVDKIRTQAAQMAK
jgi:cysteine desulfurase/selenocysteine lyase